MVMQRLESEFRKTGRPDDLKRAEQVALWRRERSSDFPLTAESSKINTEIPLVEAEIERQVARYLELGFHKHGAVKMSRGNFKDALMKLVIPRPENYKGRLDTPLIVSGQIPAKDQCKLAGINYLLEKLRGSDWPNDPQNYRTPNGFYMTWVDEGKRFMDRKVKDVRKELLLDERGGTEFDGVGLCVVKPQILQVRFLDLPGTAVGSDRAPGLFLWGGRPELFSSFVGFASPGSGSLVCGR